MYHLFLGQAWQENQGRVNSCISVLYKVFTIEEAYKHIDRIMTLKIPLSQSVAPMYLLSRTIRVGPWRQVLLPQ